MMAGMLLAVLLYRPIYQKDVQAGRPFNAERKFLIEKAWSEPLRLERKVK